VLDWAFDHLIWKSIGVQWGNPEPFIVLKTALLIKACSKSCPREQSVTVAPQKSLTQHDAPATLTHNPTSYTICQIEPMTISSENQ
jgi:hypothetical protein